jgi:hypothetical protein
MYASTRPEGWVPVERRWLGLDRRTMAPALIVIGLALVLSIVPSAINQVVAYHDEVKVGDVMQLGTNVRFVPTPGWGIVDGLRVGNATAGGAYPPTAKVVNGDVALSVTTAPFSGDADALLDQVKETTDALHHEAGFHVVSSAVPIQTAQGAEGVIARYEATGSKGLLAAFVFDGEGVQVVATGPPDTPESTVEDIARMIASVSHQAGGAQ